MGVQYVSFVAIHVSDLKRSVRFYSDVLGFREVSHLLVTGASPSARELGLDELRTEGVFLERDGMRIQLQHQDLPPEFALPPIRRQVGLSHFGVRVDDIDETLERALAAGGSLADASTRDERHARILDPDGVRIELLNMPGDPTAPIGTPTQ